MLLSHKAKFIYFHIPKTGGTSLSWQLRSLLVTSDTLPEEGDWGPGWQDKLHYDGRQHSTYRMNKRICDAHPDYFKFAFVRNPWDLALSWFTSLSRKSKQADSLPDNLTREGMKKFLQQYLFPQTVNDWWHHFKLNKGYRLLMSIPQSAYVTNRRGELQLDYIARFETYQKDGEFLMDRFGIALEKKGIEKLNQSRFGQLDYRDFYDDESRQWIAKRFRRDIDLFDYEY